ncbi:MAG: hypothetical protein KIS29_07640 [Thermoplasmata archaeon]|nr:hypothetical protein [Candidatus Sysuiplasma jiujiangense]
MKRTRRRRKGQRDLHYFAGSNSVEGMEDALVHEVRYLIRKLELIGECMEHHEKKIRKEMDERGSLVVTVPTYDR